ncbi:MAG: FtsB family cell division protein [Candidatus Acidiferrales bacterium]
MDRRLDDRRSDDRRLDHASAGGRTKLGQAVSEAELTFAEQLRQFLRRNMNWLLVGALGLLLLQDIFGTHGVLAMRRSEQEASRVQDEIRQLDQENQKLQNRVKSLKSDPSAIERIAREEMGLARPGEYIFKNQPASGDAAAPGPVPQPVQTRKK